MYIEYILDVLIESKTIMMLKSDKYLLFFDLMVHLSRVEAA